MKRIIVFDIKSSNKADDFNEILENTVNEWANKNEQYYEIADISVFGFEVLYRTNISHAKVLITYEIKQDG